jgi:ubiquinone/menaquinone biosynthesis C-methylase UbiE
MHNHKRDYLPAAGYDFALPFYDPLTRLIGADAFRRNLIRRAELESGARVLDIGCGTGTLAIAAKRACPGAEIVGIDPDPLALARARRKADRAGITVRFDQGFGHALPYADATFDHVFSSFMLHHLEPAAQRKLIAEAARVLRPDGRLQLVDFVGGFHGAHAWLTRSARASHAEHSQVELQAMLQQAGFIDTQEQEHSRVLFQHVVAYSARRPDRTTEQPLPIT